MMCKEKSADMSKPVLARRPTTTPIDKSASVPKSKRRLCIGEFEKKTQRVNRRVFDYNLSFSLPFAHNKDRLKIKLDHQFQ
jgi:hypothetical protein